ncbi:MAG: zf-HC2 domain-containing protein [Acidobacteria bacterium]|nr:zf-HC2 domain-containing protein [Acidobacteriota bacterium]
MGNEEKDGKVATGHLTPRQLEDFQRRILEPQQLLWASRHLSACGRCQRELRRARPAPSLPNLLPEAGEDLHLEYEQMTAYIDLELDEPQKQKVEEHIGLCAPCARELRDLQQLESRWSQTATPAEVKAPAQPFWERWLPAGSLPRWSWSRASALALVVLGAMGLFSVRSSVSDHNLNAVQSGADAVQHTSGSVLYVSLALIACGVLYLIFARPKKK